MTKKLSFIVVSILLLSVIFTFAGCIVPPLPNHGDGDPVTSVKVYAPDGAPALAITNIIDSKKIGNATASVTISTGEDVVAKCVSKQADIAIAPTNACATIYNVTQGEYVMVSVNIFGVLYVVGTEQITTVSQLKGNVVQSIGLGNTPEYVFKRVLDHNGVAYTDGGNDANSVNLVYQADASAIIPLFMSGKANFAVLGEPAVTNLIQKASTKDITVHRLFDLQSMWQSAVSSDKYGYPQASLIIKKSLLGDSDFVQSLTTMLQANRQFAVNNAYRLKDILASAGSTLTVDFTVDLISRCNIGFEFAHDIKQDIETYLAEFGFVADSDKPANKLPDSAFYYNA